MGGTMMSMSPGALDSAAAETYFEQHYSKDDYYSQGQTCVGRWVGKGAADLGLVGDVSRDDFSALLQGIHPRGGAVLVRSGPNGKHAAGWDSVFSAPKSVSIQALVDGDNRLIEAHVRAVDRTLTEVERYAISRQTHDRERVVSGNVVGAAFNHIAARPAGDTDHGPDPQLHTHVVLLNVTQRTDGEWRGLDPIEIYRSQRLGSALYRSELAREVQKLGYAIQVTAPNGAWELEGYSREQVMTFSQRRAEIEQGMAAAGYNGAKAAQIVALNSRQAKRDYNESELKSEWQTRAAQYQINVKAHLSQALGRGDVNVGNCDDAWGTLDFARLHTTEREAVIDRRALETAALQHGMGRVDLAALRKEIAIAEQGHTLIRAGKPDWHHPQGAFTTNEMLALERENLALVRDGTGQAQPVAEPDEVHRWGQARGLFPDQIEAARLTLTSSNWVSAIEGLAGTVGAIREFAEEHGCTVHGFGMTSGSVKALHEAGINARTIASLLENPLPEHPARVLWIVDESSLLATRPANRILHAARDQGVERIVFVGDQRQHHAIEAGAPIRQFLADHMAVAELQMIRRQRDPELRRAVELAARGKPGEALKLLEEQGRICQVPDATARYQGIAVDYLRGHEAGQATLVVSPGNDERRALNQAIRKLLVEHGHVVAQGRQHDILVRRDLTPAQLRYAQHYQEGEIIHFNRAHKKHGIDKDSYLTIAAVNRAGNSLTLRAGDDRQLQVTPAKWKGVQVYAWEHRELATGDRLQFRIHDKRNKVANGEFATVIELGAQQAKLRFDNLRELSVNLPQLRHVDYGYATTSHAAQGTTVDRVIVNVDSMRSGQLVNRKQFYVSISRARQDARVYTDDFEALRRVVARDHRKEVALEVVNSRPTQSLQPKSPTQELQQGRATGINIHR
jgi:conjugative relaxase-like TrwC/TraI family protein